MPKNIFDYQDNSPNENSINQESDLQEKAKDLISKYKNYSQNQLMQELFSIVDKQKKEGLIDKEKLQVIKQIKL
jgi:flagellar motor component MotA